MERSRLFPSKSSAASSAFADRFVGIPYFHRYNWRVVKKFTVGSRKSRLAMAQTQLVVNRLKDLFPTYKFVIQPITTSGDEIKTAKALRSAGKGVFVKELESALLRKKIDLAIHSVKDMPTDLPKGLKLAGVLERESWADVFIGRNDIPLDRLPVGSRIGTSSLRRRAFLVSRYPHLKIEDLRGNLDTRLAKLSEPGSGWAGVVVAAAGLKRLFNGRIKNYTETLPVHVMPPAPCQGILGIETREDDKRVEELIMAVNHEPTFQCAQAERSILKRLEGGCNVPIAALAEMQGNLIKLSCWLATVDGARMIHAQAVGAPDEFDQISMALEIMLKSKGASDIMSEIRALAPRNGAPKPRTVSRKSR